MVKGIGWQLVCTLPPGTLSLGSFPPASRFEHKYVDSGLGFMVGRMKRLVGGTARLVGPPRHAAVGAKLWQVGSAYILGPPSNMRPGASRIPRGWRAAT